MGCGLTSGHSGAPPPKVYRCIIHTGLGSPYDIQFALYQKFLVALGFFQYFKVQRKIFSTIHSNVAELVYSRARLKQLTPVPMVEKIYKYHIIF